MAHARVRSLDGTEIAYWTSGEGPPLLLVHGTPADHTRWRPLLPYLEPHFTVHVMDACGRGQSGDGPEYDIAREYEDVTAVVTRSPGHEVNDERVWPLARRLYCFPGSGANGQCS